MKDDITFEVRFIKGMNNVLVDAGFRWELSSADNYLDPDTLRYGFSLLDFEPEIDYCVSLVNMRCKKYIFPCPEYGPTCVGIDMK